MCAIAILLLLIRAALASAQVDDCSNLTAANITACHVRTDCFYDPYLHSCHNSLDEVNALLPCSHWLNARPCVFHGCEMVGSSCENTTTSEYVATEHIRRTQTGQHTCESGFVSLQYDVRLYFHSAVNSSMCVGPRSLHDVTTPTASCYGDTPKSISSCRCRNGMCYTDASFETGCRSLRTDGQTFNTCKAHHFFVNVWSYPLNHTHHAGVLLRSREPVQVRISLAVSQAAPAVLMSTSLVAQTTSDTTGDTALLLSTTTKDYGSMEDASGPTLSFLLVFTVCFVYYWFLAHFLPSWMIPYINKPHRASLFGGASSLLPSNAAAASVRGMYQRVRGSPISLSGRF